MKYAILLLFISLALSSCSSKSAIITSKKEAIKSRLYSNVFLKSEEPKNIPSDTDEFIENQNLDVMNTEFQPDDVAVSVKNDANLEVNVSDEFPDEIQKAEVQKETVFEEDLNYNSSLAEKIVQAALQNIGSRYHTGGITKSGFDCSGLMIYSFSKYFVKLPRTSNEMSRFGKRINPKVAQKGDLIFFKTLGNKKINHVGMVIEVGENEEIKFVHASIKRGVMISSTKEGYYRNTFAQINRVLE